MRPDSYSGIASSQRDAREDSSGYATFQSEPGIIGSTTGDVVISSGTAADRRINNIIFSSGSGGRITPNTTPTINGVPISQALLQKVEREQTKPILSYSSFNQSKKSNVDKNFALLTSPVGLPITQPKQSVGRNIYEASPVYFVESGVRGLFTKPLPYSWSDTPKDMERLRVQKQRIEAAQQLIPMVYTGVETIIKPKLMLEPKSINVNLKSAVRVASTDKQILTKANIFGEIKVKTSGFFSRTKTYIVKGVSEESGLVTKQVGASSKQPIITTEGFGRLTLTKGRNVKIVDITSEGNQVGGIGQRNIFTELKGSKGMKTLGINGEIETFVGGSTDNVIYGGSVGKKASFYVGEKVLQSPGSKSSFEFFNVETDLRSLTPTRYIREVKTPYNIEVYKVLSATQKEIPFSARLTKSNAIQILKSKKNVPNIDLRNFNINVGNVNSVAREQIGLTVQKSSYSPQTMFVNQLKATVQSLETKPVKSNPVLGGTVFVVNQKSKTKQSNQAVQIVDLSSSKKIKSITFQAQGSISNSKFNVGSLSNQFQNKFNASKSFNKMGVVQSNKNILGLNSVQNTAQIQQTISRSITKSINQPHIPTPTLVAPSSVVFPVIPTFNMGGGRFFKSRVFGGLKKTRYSPSYSALVFNLRGSYKGGKLSKSGLDFRPITKGYNLTGGGYKTQMRSAL